MTSEYKGLSAGSRLMLNIPLARYRYTAVFERDVELPVFAGSLLRSVFGLALRQSVCVTGAPACSGCPMLERCAYPALFETPSKPTELHGQQHQLPNPYIIEPPPLGTTRIRAGEPMEWHQVLVGAPTLHRLPLITSAWERSLRNGWGPKRTTGRLIHLSLIQANGVELALKPEDFATAKALPTLPLECEAPRIGTGIARLHFLTPCRLQLDGRPLLPHDFAPRKLLADLLRRCGWMLGVHMGISPAPFEARDLVAKAQTLDDDRSGLYWRDDARYSARQGRETPLGGVIGSWALRGEIGHLLPWLWLGQWLHVGKGATMGMGQYRLEVLN